MSTERDKIIRFYRGTENEQTAIRLVDLAERASKNGKFTLSPFLTPYEQNMAETIAASFPSLTLEFSGGYVGAERQRVVFADKEFRGTPTFNIVVVRADWAGDMVRFSHRDVLGAVMGLGVERDTVGDIIATDNFAKILITAEMEQFFIDNLTQIGASRVKTSSDDLTNIAPKEERVKEIRATVASMRIDSIAAAGFGFSRSRAAADIAADKIKLNWQDVKNAAQQVKEGDILSMRGRGRLEVSEIRGQTKKGRVGVVLKRYM